MKSKDTNALNLCINALEDISNVLMSINLTIAPMPELANKICRVEAIANDILKKLETGKAYESNSDNSNSTIPRITKEAKISRSTKEKR